MLSNFGIMYVVSVEDYVLCYHQITDSIQVELEEAITLLSGTWATLWKHISANKGFPKFRLFLELETSLWKFTHLEDLKFNTATISNSK